MGGLEQCLACWLSGLVALVATWFVVADRGSGGFPLPIFQYRGNCVENSVETINFYKMQIRREVNRVS